MLATTPPTFRVAVDGIAYLRDKPGVLAEVATLLAGRLSLLTAYLADLRRQYDGTPGLEMVGEVLGALSGRSPDRFGRARPAIPTRSTDPDSGRCWPVGVVLETSTVRHALGRGRTGASSSRVRRRRATTTRRHPRRGRR